MTVLGLLLVMLAPLTQAGASPFDEARIAMRAAGVEDGLPNPRVHCTFQDRAGRLWVGTQEGAAFLGGGGWTPFPLPREAPSLYIRAIAQTDDGALWFGTEGGGLWRHAGGGWRHWDLGSGLPVSRVNALLAQGPTLWIGTGGGGLLLWTGEAMSAVSGPTDPWVWALAAIPDERGVARIWVGGEQQVWFQQEPGWRHLGPRDGFWETGANAIASRTGPDGRREVWLAAWKKGIGRWDAARERFDGPLAGSPSRSPTALAAVKRADGAEEIWVGTYDVGLVRLRERGYDVFGPAQGFPSTGIYCLLVNPDGRPSLWVGTRGAGLVAVDPSGWRTLPPLPRVPSAQANCFLDTEAPSGAWTFWIGTDRGLARWTAEGVALETTAQGLPSDFVTDIEQFEGPGGPELWVATLSGVARRRGPRWEQFSGWDELHFDRVQALAADRLPDGRLRVYAGGDGGLAVLEDGRWQLVEGGQTLPPNAIVTSLRSVADPDGSASLWVGMRGGGIARLKKEAWRTFATRDGLPNLSVYGLVDSVSPAGRRWLWATMVGGGGLARLDMDRVEDGFRTWAGNEPPGFPNQGVQRAVVGADGALHLTTSRGVVRLDIRGADSEVVQATTFRTSDGLPSAASESGAIYVDRAGRVWVGTAKGIAVLDPAQERAGAPPRAPIVEQVLVQGRPVLPPGAPVRMGHRDQRLRVTFGLPAFLRYEATLYRTQLIGLEAAPQEWSSRAEREFTTLPANEYTLRIWGRDGLGRESPHVDLSITVVPPWWQTYWARGPAALGVAALVGFVVRRRQRVLVKRAEALEKLVAERTRDLEAANQALHQQSLTDPLTGLHNRRSLQSQIGALTSRLVRRQRHSEHGTDDPDRDLGFLILDLDHFKHVNDTWGHQAGDSVLRATADLLLEVVREGDLLIRWGGEEFLLVAPDTRAEELPRLAERIRSTFAAHAFENGAYEAIHRTVSIGFVAMPLLSGHAEAFNWEQMLSLADQCLYRAKGSGRNRWVGLMPVEHPPDGLVPADEDWDALASSGWIHRVEGPASPES
jgi:diguanylate cyclase (GGDEF)-like protein